MTARAGFLIGYGDYRPTFTITSSPGSSAGVSAFLSGDGSAMADGRTGMVESFSFDSSAAALTQYTEIDVSVTSTLDATPAWGVVGVCNVQGLPEGTKLTFNGVTQRLVADEFGYLNAWWLPSGVTGAGPKGIRIYNDVNGSHSITPGSTCAIGEVFVGRLIALKALALSQPTDNLTDTTVSTIMAEGTVYEVMRKPRRAPVSAKIGLYTTAQAKGGSSSDLPAGVGSQTIDIRRLRAILATSRVCAVCDSPTAGRGSGSDAGAYRVDTDWMQSQWMLARPLDIGSLVQDQYPYWTWSPTWQAAS